jgi:hypothetical protein
MSRTAHTFKSFLCIGNRLEHWRLIICFFGSVHTVSFEECEWHGTHFEKNKKSIFYRAFYSKLARALTFDNFFFWLCAHREFYEWHGTHLKKAFLYRAFYSKWARALTFDYFCCFPQGPRRCPWRVLSLLCSDACIAPRHELWKIHFSNCLHKVSIWKYTRRLCAHSYTWVFAVQPCTKCAHVFAYVHESMRMYTYCSRLWPLRVLQPFMACVLTIAAVYGLCCDDEHVLRPFVAFACVAAVYGLCISAVYGLCCSDEHVLRPGANSEKCRVLGLEKWFRDRKFMC